MDLLKSKETEELLRVTHRTEGIYSQSLRSREVSNYRGLGEETSAPPGASQGLTIDLLLFAFPLTTD